jgi:hypothetical protein
MKIGSRSAIKFGSRLTGDAVDVAVPLQMVLSLEGVECRALVGRGYRRCLRRESQHRAKLVCVHYGDEPGIRAATKLLTRNEAGRIAANVARLSELLKKP